MKKFETFLRVVGKGGDDEALERALWSDLEMGYADQSVGCLPEKAPSIERLKSSEWYSHGGYKKIREDEILREWPLNKQAEAHTDALIEKPELQQELKVYIAQVKAKWEKPC